jgi:hypothetical protein
MTLRELLVKELDLLVGLISEYRRDFSNKFAVFQSRGDQESFKGFVDAYVTLKSAEDRVELINEVLGEASE